MLFDKYDISKLVFIKWKNNNFPRNNKIYSTNDIQAVFLYLCSRI